MGVERAAALVLLATMAAAASGCSGGPLVSDAAPADRSSTTPATDAPAPAAPSSGPSSGPSSVAGEVLDADVAAARAGLEDLRVVERHPAGLPPYDRDAFGEPWDDTDGNGCNQRDDVLLRDVLPGTVVVQRQDSCDHDVLAGSWLDPYTGALLTFDDLKDSAQAQAIQIDHVVPLAEAWRSGASSWTAERRAAYANDLDALLAVDGPTNASKGAEDPAAWRPRKAYQCAYGVRWILTKSRWGLAADVSEVRALSELLGHCP